MQVSVAEAKKDTETVKTLLATDKLIPKLPDIEYSPEIFFWQGETHY